MIIEVLPPLTAAFDRNEKFYRYRQWNPTLREYILVAQEQPLVEQFIRQADDDGLSYLFRGLAATVPVQALNCELPLHDIYRNLSFA